MATAARRSAMEAIVQYTYLVRRKRCFVRCALGIMIRICGSSYSLLLLKHNGGVMTMG